MIRRGAEWGRPATEAPTVLVHGDDAALAAAATAHPGELLELVPSAASDLARAVGLAAADPERGRLDVPLDALRVERPSLVVCNMLVVGTPPARVGRATRQFRAEIVVDHVVRFSGRLTTIVVAVGEFLRGDDVVPRGHPGDGRAEVQAYAVPAAQRGTMRDRLRSGTHVPHPGITECTGREIEIRTGRHVRVEADGHEIGPVEDLLTTVVPGAYRLLV